MTPKYLLEWVDLSLLGLSKVFRIKTNRLSGVAWTRFENSVRLSFLAVSWMVVSRVFLFKKNRLCCVMWRRFQNLIKSFMLGFHVFFLSFPCQDRWTLLCHEIFTKPRFRNTVKLSFVTLTCQCGVFMIWIDGPLGGSLVSCVQNSAHGNGKSIFAFKNTGELQMLPEEPP